MGETMIQELVLNEPMNPNGPTTYEVGHRLWGHKAHEGKVTEIREIKVPGQGAMVPAFMVIFENGVTRTVYGHAVASYQEVPI